MRESTTFAEGAFASLPFATVVGMLAIVIMALLGFEEAYMPMLVVGAMLLLAAPLGLAIHLGVTKELTIKEKRLWVDGLLSWRGPALFPAYFTQNDQQIA